MTGNHKTLIVDDDQGIRDSYDAIGDTFYETIKVEKSKMNRIIAVDDEKNNLKAIKRIFKDLDCMMEFAQNGEEALNLVNDFKPDLILLDIMMPGIDGYEVCRRLKSDIKTSEIMVLLLSGKSHLEDRLKGYEVDADDYITKPYDSDELRAKVKILLRLKNVQDELRILNQNLEKLVEVRTRELVKKERQAIIGQMVQGIVHNLRGPIMAVGGRAEMATIIAKELIKKSKDNFKASVESVEKIIDNLDHLTDAVNKTEMMIDTLLVKSRQEATDEKQQLNINDLLVKELEFLQPDMDLKHNVKKNLILDPSLPEIFGIYSDFTQVIYNLIANALNAMDESTEKELTIITKYYDQNIYLLFRDTGKGISTDNLERIFDPFFTTKPKKGDEKKGEATGTGLGLFTCSELMKSYGATISVKSKEGKWTTFTVKIPVEGQSD